MKLFEFDIHIGDWRVLVQGRDIQNGAVEGRHIADNTIPFDKFRQDEKIPVSKIADNTIPGSKLDGQIPTEKLVDKSVDGSKLAPGAVTRDKIADEAVDDLNALYIEMRGELEQEISGEFSRQDQSISTKFAQQTADISSRQDAIENEQSSQRQLISTKFADQDSKMNNMQATINAKQLEIGAVETDLEPVEHSPNRLTSGTLYDVYGHFKEIPEFVRVELDSDNKVLEGEQTDGTKVIGGNLLVNGEAKVVGETKIGGVSYKMVENPEFLSVELDADEKVLGGIKIDGTKFENAGIETNHLELTEQGMSDFQQALKNAGFHPGGAGDFSDYISNDGEVPLYISEPRCAYINISGVDSMPISKNVDLHAYMEVYDYNGNYFKKKVILNAQGNSSLANPQKNFAVDMFDSDWDGDAFSLKIGDWVPQDSFHFKCFYYDPIRGLADVLYKFAERAIKYTNTRPNRLAIDEGVASVYTDSGTFNFDYDTGALCHPDGFPAVVYLNGEFYGLFAWNLKKHRDNYLMDKKDYETIHIDSDTANLWSNDPIDWTLFEIRNPKTLICMDGSKYDGDDPKELIDSTSPNYDSSNKDHKNTAKTKNLINALHTVVSAINSTETTEAKKLLFEQYFDVDSFIVFFILSQVMDNYDGLWGRNTQWLYYKKSGKWCPSLYDLDCCMGYLANVPWLRNPLQTVLGTDTNLPYGLLWNLYRDEVKAVYNDLRSSNVLTTAGFVEMVEDWCSRFGLPNLQRSIKKWNTPMYRDGKINGDYWVLDGYNLSSNVPEEERFSDTKQYLEGDLVYFGVTSSYIMRYKCKQPCIGEVPAGRYDEEPYYGGCFDSPRRIRKWLDSKFQYLDNLMR